jgi:hypothetical protein
LTALEHVTGVDLPDRQWGMEEGPSLGEKAAAKGCKRQP